PWSARAEKTVLVTGKASRPSASSTSHQTSTAPIAQPEWSMVLIVSERRMRAARALPLIDRRAAAVEGDLQRRELRQPRRLIVLAFDLADHHVLDTIAVEQRRDLLQRGGVVDARHLLSALRHRIVVPAPQALVIAPAHDRRQAGVAREARVVRIGIAG